MAYYDETNTLQRFVYSEVGAEGEDVKQTGSVDAVQTAFDSSFRPKTLTDALNNVSQQTYDKLGNATNFSFPMAGSVPQNTAFDTSQASYDLDQNLNKLVDGNGTPFLFTLAPDDSRVTAVTYPTGTRAPTNYVYDAYQRVVQRTDNEGTYYFVYDDLDNLTEARTLYTGQPEMDVS